MIKTPDCNDTNAKVTKKNYDEIKTPLIHMFNLSTKTRIFSDKSEIARVSPIFPRQFF